MSRIYTKTGDTGMTAIHGGIRVPKTDVRIEANGCLDELNVATGGVRTLLPAGHEWQPLLKGIQHNVMTAMSLVATRSDMRGRNPNCLPEDLVSGIESRIDAINGLCTLADSFIMPGGTPVSTALHWARVTARRAERWLWHLHGLDPVPGEILKYMNRLSDLFFVMARYELQQSGCEEEKWREFGYKRKSR